jgi:hypothetical protein
MLARLTQDDLSGHRENLTDELACRQVFGPVRHWTEPLKSRQGSSCARAASISIAAVISAPAVRISSWEAVCVIGVLRHEVIERVTQWAVGRFVVPAVSRDRAGRHLDRGRLLRERYDRAALQQPDEASAVISAQALIGRVRVGRDLVEAKQIAGGPS